MAGVPLVVALLRAEKEARGKGGETALLWAVQEGYFGIVELLLQRGSDVNIQKNDGATALFLGSSSHTPPQIPPSREHGFVLGAQQVRPSLPPPPPICSRAGR